MRISDWSSDVCSSDLVAGGGDRLPIRVHTPLVFEHDLIHSVALNCAGDSDGGGRSCTGDAKGRSEEHTSELQSPMSMSYAVFCLKNKKTKSTSSNTRN